MARASCQSLRSAASTIRDISAGTSFPDTEMTPRPPIDITGSASASSPLSTMKSAGTRTQTSQICDMLPDASFTATMFGIAARRASVAGSTLQPVRPGTL
jgi:hypothetical protein